VCFALSHTSLCVLLLRFQVEFYRENILINDNVMEACRRHKVQKLVSFLSTCIFPDKTTYPIDESMVHNGPPHFSNEGYVLHLPLLLSLPTCFRGMLLSLSLLKRRCK